MAKVIVTLRGGARQPVQKFKVDSLHYGSSDHVITLSSTDRKQLVAMFPIELVESIVVEEFKDQD